MAINRGLGGDGSLVVRMIYGIQCARVGKGLMGGTFSNNNRC